MTRFGAWLSDPTLERIATSALSVAVTVLIARRVQRGGIKGDVIDMASSGPH